MRRSRTEGDLLFHIWAQELGICFELARLIRQQLPSGSVVVDEVQGFQYLDQRDPLARLSQFRPEFMSILWISRGVKVLSTGVL